jgi:hypothetical protein
MSANAPTDVQPERPADEQLAAFRDFRRAGEALAADHDRAGLHLKAAALRGALVVLGNQTVEEVRLAEPGYQATIVALSEISDGRFPRFR